MTVFKRYKKLIFLIIGIVIIFASLFLVKILNKEKIEYVTARVESGDLSQTVSVTGSVVSDLVTDLHFEANGRVDKINFSEGDTVYSGDVIAELIASNENIQVKEARAALSAAQANLDLKRAGSMIEDVRVAEANVNFAKVSLEIAKTSLDNIKVSGNEDIKSMKLAVKNSEISLDAEKAKLENSEKSLQNTKDQEEQSVDEAHDYLTVTIEKNLIKTYEYLIDLDDILGVDNEHINDDFEDSLGILKSTTLQNAQDSYRVTNALYKNIKDNFSGTEDNTIDETKGYADDMEIVLYSLDNTLLKTRILLNNSVVSTGLTSTMLNSFKSTIDTNRIGVNSEINSLQSEKQDLISSEISKRTNIDSAQSSYDTANSNYEKAKTSLDISLQNLNRAKIDLANSIKDAELKISSKERALETAQASYEFKKASPRKVDVASLEAQVSQASAMLALAERNLEKTKLIAPNDGVMISINSEIGENMTISKNFAVMISSKLIIEADISESDIDKLILGQKVSLTFDAFGDYNEFYGEVYFIDPAETKIQDVIYYKVKVALDESKGKSIRSGMTVNLDILTNHKNDILIVPQRTIIEKNGKNIIRVFRNEKAIEREVVTGIRGDMGMIEVKSGLVEGQEIVVGEKK